MVDSSSTKEHMEVAASDGKHVGTVDTVEDDSIKLTRTDFEDHQHHMLSLDLFDRVSDNRIYLRVSKSEALTAAR